MQTNKASEAPAKNKRIYEDFEPYCKWRSEDEGREILEIDIKGFKKEQLKVQANGKGTLIVSGERPADGTHKKWIRFRKETTLPKDCNYKDVRAKLCKGSLSIIMPTKLPHHQKNNENNNNSSSKVTVWGVKIDKGRFLKVAVVVTAVVLVVAVARLAEVYRHPSHDEKHHHVHV